MTTFISDKPKINTGTVTIVTGRKITVKKTGIQSPINPHNVLNLRLSLISEECKALYFLIWYLLLWRCINKT